MTNANPNKGIEKRRSSLKRRMKKDLRDKNEMLRRSGGNIKFDYWGWTPDDETPFLVCRIYFNNPIKPINFLDDLKSILSELFHEHI